jgi:hypothetical protein
MRPLLITSGSDAAAAKQGPTGGGSIHGAPARDVPTAAAAAAAAGNAAAAHSAAASRNSSSIRPPPSTRQILHFSLPRQGGRLLLSIAPLAPFPLPLPPPPPPYPIPFFRYWIDSQALSSAASTVLLERALVALGGRRTGGPAKRVGEEGEEEEAAEEDQEEQEEGRQGGRAAMQRQRQQRQRPVSPPSSLSLAPPRHPRPPHHATPPRLYGYMRMGDWDFLWSITAKAMLAAELLRPGQLVSVVPGCLSISRKTSLVRSLCGSYGRALAFARVVPLTFKLPEEMALWARELAREEEEQQEALEEEEEAEGAARRPSSMWMLKNNKQRGTGLRLVRGGGGGGAGGPPPGGAAAALRAALETSTRATGRLAGLPLYRWYLAQRYVSDPLLLRPYGGSTDWLRAAAGGPARAPAPPPLDNRPRKFGLRLWALVPSAAPPFRAYIHQCGLALFSSRAYTADPWGDEEEEEGQKDERQGRGGGGGARRHHPHHPRPPVPEGHLTNAARNAGAPVWPLRRVADTLGPRPWRELWDALCASSALALAASVKRVQDLRAEVPLPPGGAFQLFGLDFVVDADLKPWLLEVNATPSMRVDHPCPVSAAVVEAEKWPAVWDAMALLRVGPERFSGAGGVGVERGKGREEAGVGGGGARRTRGVLSRLLPWSSSLGGGGRGRRRRDGDTDEEDERRRRRSSGGRSGAQSDHRPALLAAVREEMRRAGGYCPLTHLFPDADNLPGCTVPWTRADDALRRWLVAEQRRSGVLWHAWRQGGGGAAEA